MHSKLQAIHQQNLERLRRQAEQNAATDKARALGLRKPRVGKVERLLRLLGLR